MKRCKEKEVVNSRPLRFAAYPVFKLSDSISETGDLITTFEENMWLLECHDAFLAYAEATQLGIEVGQFGTKLRQDAPRALAEIGVNRERIAVLRQGTVPSSDYEFIGLRDLVCINSDSFVHGMELDRRTVPSWQHDPDQIPDRESLEANSTELDKLPLAN